MTSEVPALLNEAVEVIPGAAGCGIVLLCDHATNIVPESYSGLGLPEFEFSRHIAYDIGAEGVTRQLSRLLGAPAVLSRYSRLLIDPNRGPDDPTLVMRLSDGAIIPGNRHLDAAERARRIARFYRPYHDAIDRTVDACLAAGRPPVLLSMHSFTDNWRGREREWHAGVLWDRDPRLASRLLDAFRAVPALVVGDNQPYSGELRGDTLWQHGMMRGLASSIIEIRQDLIREPDAQAHWAKLVAGIMSEIVADAAADLFRVANYRNADDEELARYLAGLKPRAAE